MLAVTFYDIVVWIHVSAVVAAFGGIIAYPLALGAMASAEPAARVAFHRVGATVGANIMRFGMIVALLAGIYLATDRSLWSEMWVSVSMLIILVLFGLLDGVIAPGQRKAAELAGAGGAEYEAVAGRLRLVAIISTVLVLIALFFMIVKPG